MAIVTVGIDLAKNVFAVHGVDATTEIELFADIEQTMPDD